jgi:hypothetical protein
MGTPAELARYEQRFRRAGLPAFIEDFSPTHDIFTRATPLLVLVFLAEVLGATSLDWPVWVNLVTAGGALVVLIAGFGLLNGFRGRPFWSLPTRFGIPELSVFVLLPALFPLATQGQVRQFFGIAVGNLLLIGAVYVVVGYGLIATTYWSLRRLAGDLADSIASMVRALPLLLVFSLVLFINTEMWQVFSLMPQAYVAAVAGLLALVAAAFLVGRLPREVVRLQGDGPQLNPRQRVNVGLVMFVSQALQVLVVSLALAGFFVVFGALTIGPEVRESWIGSRGDAIGPSIELLGGRLTITEELVRVSGAIAAFGGVYYAIAVLTDSTYREEFLDDIVGELRETFALRAEYLSLRGSSPRT